MVGKRALTPVENAETKARSQPPPDPIRFGPYEIDRRKGEVRKFGVKLKLGGQPFEVLLLLVERAGELVSREELRKRLWPEDVFVDFERSLNTVVKKLRAALGDNPDNPQYIETQPRKGYRFIGEIKDLDPLEGAKGRYPTNEQSVPLPPATSDHRLPDFKNPAPSHLFRWISAALAFVILAGGWFLTVRQRVPKTSMVTSGSKGPNVRSSIAILGFKNLSSEHEGEWLGSAIAQMLATELQSDGKLRIVPEESVSQAKKRLDLNEKDGYPRDTLRALQKNLASDYVVAGSYVALGDRATGQVRLDLRLQESISGETLASIAVSGNQSEIFDLVERAGREMRAKVGGTIGPEGDADWRATLPSNPEAARLYSAGLSHMRVGNDASAIELLRKSLAIESDFALGHAALAEAWQSLGYDDRAQASAQKALSLTAALPENVRVKVEGQFYESQHDWEGAILAYQHLFQDYPDDADAGLKLAASEVSGGRLSEAASTISSLRSLPNNVGRDLRIDLVAALLAARTGEYKRQQELAQSAAKKAESSGSHLLLARARMIEGWALDDQSQLDKALQSYRAAQTIFESEGDIDSTATVLDDIGIVLEKQGNLRAARDNMEESQKRFRQVGDQNGLGAALTNLGELFHVEGDLGAATELYREALEIFRKTSRKENEYATLNNLGGVLFESGDFREARKNFETLLQVSEIGGNQSTVGHAKSNLAAVLWVQGDLNRSSELLEEALRTFREMGDRAAVASAETAYSKVLILKDDLPGARKALSDALRINEEIGSKTDAAFDRILFAQVSLSEGHVAQVDEAILQSSIDQLRAEERPGDEIEALGIQIQVLLANGKLEAAQQSLARAQGLHNTNWLSSYHLTLAAARIDTALGNIAASRRKVNAARSQASKVGCRACDLESNLFLSRSEVERRAKTNPSISFEDGTAISGVVRQSSARLIP
jgi:tetratricopeptide (TPR) repeat protein/DNA-binding winged helix-turn-helix (wHTH) protein